MIRVQSKNKFPSDFFNENSKSEQNTQQSEDANTQNNNQINFKFFQPNISNKYGSKQIQQIPQYQQNQNNIMKLSQQLFSNSKMELSNTQQLQQNDQNKQQTQTPKHIQSIQRPFISAMSTRSTKSPSFRNQQVIDPLNQIKKDFQFSKNNFIGQQYDSTFNPQQFQSINQIISQQSHMLSQKQFNLGNNLLQQGSLQRQNSAQIPNLGILHTNKFCMNSPFDKIQQSISPQKNNNLLTNQIQLNKATSQPQSTQDINFYENELKLQKDESKKYLSTPNSPKNSLNSSQSRCSKKNKSNKSSDSKSKAKTETSTPQQEQTQNNKLNDQQNQILNRAQSQSIPKRFPYGRKFSSNLNETFSKQIINTKQIIEQKDKSLIISEENIKDNSKIESHKEQIPNKYFNRKPSSVNKSREYNIDFANFQMPLTKINKKIKEVSLQKGKQEKTIKSITNINYKQQKLDMSTSVSNSSHQSSSENQMKNMKILSAKKLQKTEKLSENIAEQDDQIEECIERNKSDEHIKEEQTTFEIENSDSTKNSFQQNNTNSLNSASIQNDNLNLFSDKNIQSVQNSMVGIPPPQLQYFYSDCCDSMTQIQQQNPFLSHKTSLMSDENVLNTDQSGKLSYQQISRQNSSTKNQQLYQNEFIQEQENLQNLNNSINTYNRTANFTNYKALNFNLPSQNDAQKLKSSNKALPKIALNFKESEKYIPFLIRKVNSQNNMRVKSYLQNTSSRNSANSNQTCNVVLDFNKNGQKENKNSQTNNNATPNLLNSNDNITSHEFSFCNQ